jgi:orotate phosphoribosyltransferase-like protein
MQLIDLNLSILTDVNCKKHKHKCQSVVGVASKILSLVSVTILELKCILSDYIAFAVKTKKSKTSIMPAGSLCRELLCKPSGNPNQIAFLVRQNAI